MKFQYEHNRRKPVGSVAVQRLAACFLVVGVLFCGSAGAADKPNIVIVLVDDMGDGDPGCYNADSKIPTPKRRIFTSRGPTL